MPIDKNSGRLDGLKAIADYLDISVRNVYRWQKKGMPVYQVAGDKGRRVFAYKNEIDEWLNGSESPLRNKKLFTFNKNQIIFASTIIAGIVLITVWIASSSTAEEVSPQSIVIDGPNIVVKNSKDAVLWLYRIDEKYFYDSKLSKLVVLKDLDNDRQMEILTRQYYHDEDEYKLVLYDNDGRAIWERGISPVQAYNSLFIAPDYRLEGIITVQTPGASKLIVTYWNHQVRFTSVICSFDLNGKLIDQYMHTGHISSFEVADVGNDGSLDILFGATNNLLDGEGVLGVIPLRGFKGLSPPYSIETEYAHLSTKLSNYIPDNPREGNQRFYYRFKSPGLMKKFLDGYRSVKIEQIDDNSIVIILSEWTAGWEPLYVGPCYVFDNSLNFINILPSGTLDRSFTRFLENSDDNISLDELLRVYAKSLYRWENGIWVKIN